MVGCGTITGFTVTHTAMLCARHEIQNRLSHIYDMFEDTKMRSGLYFFFHIALLNDVSYFTLCMSDRLFE